MDKSIRIKNVMPPREGLCEADHRIAFFCCSSLMPRVLEKRSNKMFIKIETPTLNKLNNIKVPRGYLFMNHI